MRLASLTARAFAAAAFATLALAPLSVAHAYEPFAFLIPCRATASNSVGTPRPCITCHNNPNGGQGCDARPCFNEFGEDFNNNNRVWNEALAEMDSDEDGYTNGEELGDPTGTWDPTMPTPGTCGCASRPGFATCPPNGADSRCTPGDTDADGDGFCCIGADLDMNGDCLGTGEDASGYDCDDSSNTVSSGAPEMCTNAIDNDCDGYPTLSDEDCAAVVDRDGDGFCPMGRDNNRDRDCNDAGENTADMDCDDDEPRRYPGAREHCRDGLDNDCNGLIDDMSPPDPMCRNDVDADMDGYCPIGRDLNANRSCNDSDEERNGGIDCDDSSALANPMQSEQCSDGIDNDCNGLVDFRDPACAEFFDEDGDGYCERGRDGNGDGDCADPGEDVGPGDCQEGDPTINPGAMEICTNGSVNDDCDEYEESLDDPDCAGYLDTDGDRYCFVGFDMNRDGRCLGDEITGQGDCDDSNAAFNPEIAESCTDGADNDCDGTADAEDRFDCWRYVDNDRDGYCIVGRDLDGDGDCDGAGEQEGPTEVEGTEDPAVPRSRFGTDDDPTTYPGAPENCLDGKDNDLNGVVDDPDYCTRERDADGDGYCPIGQDLNGDGDCLDEGENRAVTDCNEMEAAINPGAAEQCMEIVDADCDGLWGTKDDDCAIYLDRDRDGTCAMGVDDNGDFDCLDMGEQRFGRDCNDLDPAINARAREVCDDGVDNDCDGDVDWDDMQCTCDAASECDDGDPCTAEMCVDRRCTFVPNPGCGDAGMEPPPPPPDCSCRAASGSAPVGLGWMLAALVFTLRRRRAR